MSVDHGALKRAFEVGWQLLLALEPWRIEHFAAKFLRVSSGMQLYYSIICPIEGIEIRIIAYSKLIQIYLSRNSFVQIRDNDQTGLANFSRRKHEVSLPRHYKDETSRMTDEI